MPSIRELAERRFPIGATVTPIKGYGLGGIRQVDQGSTGIVAGHTRQGNLLISWNHEVAPDRSVGHEFLEVVNQCQCGRGGYGCCEDT